MKLALEEPAQPVPNSFKPGHRLERGVIGAPASSSCFGCVASRVLPTDAAGSPNRSHVGIAT
jgi:hypothetical protein